MIYLRKSGMANLKKNRSKHTNSQLLYLLSFSGFLSKRGVLGPWSTAIIDHPTQTDGVSCGIYVLKVLENKQFINVRSQPNNFLVCF